MTISSSTAVGATQPVATPANASASGTIDLAQAVLVGEDIQASLGKKLSALDEDKDMSVMNLLGIQQDTALLSVQAAIVSGVTRSLTDIKKDLLRNL